MMEISYVYTTIIIGIVVSLIFTECTGIAAGGIVVPAYLALTVKEPVVLISTFAIGIVSYIIVEFGLSKLMILYGKRKFVALIFIALALRLIFNAVLGNVFTTLDAFTSVGIVTAALIASTISKQGLRLTVLGTVIVTTIVYASVELISII